MIKIIKYEFLSLLKNTHYIEVCTFMVIYSFILTVLPLFNSAEIQLETLGKFELFTFISNQENRTLYYFFMVLMPLFSTLAISQLLIKEKKCEILIHSRCSKKKTVYSQLIVSFFSGFSTIFIVLSCSLIFSAIILYSTNQNIYFFATPISPNNTHLVKLVIPFYNLFLSSPLLLILVYISLISILGGLLCQVTTVISYFTNNRLVIYIGAFVIMFITGMLGALFPWIGNALDPLTVVGFGNIFIIVICFITLITFITCMVIYKLKRDEV